MDIEKVKEKLNNIDCVGLSLSQRILVEELFILMERHKEAFNANLFKEAKEISAVISMVCAKLYISPTNIINKLDSGEQ